MALVDGIISSAICSIGACAHRIDDLCVQTHRATHNIVYRFLIGRLLTGSSAVSKPIDFCCNHLALTVSILRSVDPCICTLCASDNAKALICLWVVYTGVYLDAVAFDRTTMVTHHHNDARLNRLIA